MRDDALQLVAGQVAQGPARDAYGSVLRRVAGGEGVDGLVAIDDVAERHRQTGGQRHLLDDVQVTTLRGVPGGRADQPAAEALRDGAAALGEFRDAQQAAAEDDREREARGEAKQLRLEPVAVRPVEDERGDTNGARRHGLVTSQEDREDVEGAGQHHDR